MLFLKKKRPLFQQIPLKEEQWVAKLVSLLITLMPMIAAKKKAVENT